MLLGLCGRGGLSRGRKTSEPAGVMSTNILVLLLFVLTLMACRAAPDPTSDDEFQQQQLLMSTLLDDEDGNNERLCSSFLYASLSVLLTRWTINVRVFLPSKKKVYSICTRLTPWIMNVSIDLHQQYATRIYGIKTSRKEISDPVFVYKERCHSSINNQAG